MDENNDETPHPLSRMVSIGNPHFWIFITACFLLFICDKFISPNSVDQFPFDRNETLIISAAFAGLFVNLIQQAIKSVRFQVLFSKICIAFEILTILIFAFLVFIKLV